MRSVDTFCPPRVVVRSTTGLAPLTVTVSCTDPTFIETFTRAAKPAFTSRPWRTSGSKPWISKRS
ncbi:MAG: hypothetical protein DMF93_02155 [Acidobacteria bacterium]|nr:MAG: hypothetical protein DMF93_02155 [Acidobacteriota bacterium]